MRKLQKNPQKRFKRITNKRSKRTTKNRPEIKQKKIFSGTIKNQKNQ